jgi:Flp pilus assembly protein TadD
VRLSPADIFSDKYQVYYALVHFQAGRYAQAARAAEQAIQLRLKHANSHMLAASCYAHAGEMEKAAEALAAFTALVPNTTANNVERAIAYKDRSARARLADGLRLASLAD